MATFTTEQTLPVTFSIKDGRGRPASVDGDPVTASSDATVVTVDTPVRAGSDWTFNVMSVAPGTARVSVTADANLNPDETTEIVGFLDVEVTLDPRTGARVVELVAGTPVDE